jgi:hypothetical protein
LCLTGEESRCAVLNWQPEAGAGRLVKQLSSIFACDEIRQYFLFPASYSEEARPHVSGNSNTRLHGVELLAGREETVIGDVFLYDFIS